MAPGVWRVVQGENLSSIYDKAKAENGIQLSRSEFLANVRRYQRLGGKNEDVIRPDQLIMFFKPDAGRVAALSAEMNGFLGVLSRDRLRLMWYEKNVLGLREPSKDCSGIDVVFQFVKKVTSSTDVAPWTFLLARYYMLFSERSI